MIQYSCEVSLSLDKAVKDLDRIGQRYEVLHETVLGFRSKPCRKVKEVLTRCGFVRDDQAVPPSDEALTALCEKFS